MTDDAAREIDGVVDAAIDRAVREMLRVEPPPGARARMLARLEHPARPALTIPRLAAVTALAALIVLAWVFTREPAREPAATSIAQRAPEPPVQTMRDATAADSRKSSEQLRISERAPSARTAGREDTPASAAFSGAIAIAPLTRLDPIVVAPLEPSPVASEDIVIEPLASIAELEIAPLFPSDGRN